MFWTLVFQPWCCKKSQLLISSLTSSEWTSLAPRPIQTAKVISHTEAFNYVWLNGSCLASRMTSRLNNRTIRALSGADGNTTWYLLNAPPSARAHSQNRTQRKHQNRVCVFTLVSSNHLKLVLRVLSLSLLYLHACLKIQHYVFHRLISEQKKSSLGTTECKGRWVACWSDKQWVRQGNVSPQQK